MWNWLKPYRLVPGYLKQAQLTDLRGQVLESPYLGASALSNGFEGTVGYSLVFRREGIMRVCEHMPALEPYLEKVLDGRCNAFFLNPLIIGKGNKVEPHADCSLLSLTHPTRIRFPLKTSVLYLRVPEDLKGGELRFHLVVPIVTIRPQENLLIEFLGSFRHSVTKVEKSSEPRASLVLEQYRMKPQALALIPEFMIHTDRQFNQFLDEAIASSELDSNG